MTSNYQNNNFGDPIKFDREFKGPQSKRSCTDVFCLLIFIIFLGCWGFIGYYAISQGDLDRLLVPSDSSGRRCGVDSEVVKKPYLLFFNIEKCISPLVPINGCPTPQVCVEECPTKMFFFVRDKCTNGNLKEIINDLICIRDVDKKVIETCDDVDKLVNSEHCARWYLPSDSLLKRCISPIHPTICPRIPKNYIDERLPKPTTLNGITRSIDEPEIECKTRNKLGHELLMDKMKNHDTMLSRFIGNAIAHMTNSTDAQQEGQKIVEDIISSWINILCSFLLAVLVCLIVIAMMRWIAGPLLWLTILGIIGMLSFGIYYSYKTYKDLAAKTEPSFQPAITNLNALFKSYLSDKNTWLVLLIISAILLVIILLVVLVLRKRIIIAIALVKEGSKAVSSTISTVFFPIFPWIFQIGVIGFAVVVGLYLASVGQQHNIVTGFTNDTNCKCVGMAADYKDGDSCDPKIFYENCHDSIGGLTRFFRQDNDNPCLKAACNFQSIENPKVVIYFHIVNIIGFFWTVFFISAFGEMVLAMTFATWYWSFKKSDVPFFTVTLGLYRTVRYHLGTLAFGSLIVTICRLIRLLLEYCDQKLKKYDNAVTRAILCCMKCFFWCLEKFLKFLNKNAYIMCAIHGKNFCGSAKDAFNLLMRNFLRVIALDKVTDFLFFLAKALVTIGMGALTYFYYDRYQPYRLNYIAVPVVIVMIGTYLITTVFFGVYTMAVNTLFLCFLEDCERNDGSPDRPYFMSKQLMKILGKKNKLSRSNQDLN